MSQMKHFFQKNFFPRLIKKKISSLCAYKNFRQDFNCFTALSTNARFPIRWKDRYPCLSDKNTHTPYDTHYTLHTAWAARVLARTKPVEHIDIGSLLYFSTLVSAFIPTRFYDYRPLSIDLPNLQTEKANLTALSFSDNSILSLSSMHVVEHIGLGRYGDPIDPDGDLKAINELTRVLAVGGDLLFVVPVGSPKIMFNAHRIYSYDQILDCFKDLYLQEFALIEDHAAATGFVINPDRHTIAKQTYACGCFWFNKRASQ